MPPPVPPSVKLGRITAGKPVPLHLGSDALLHRPAPPPSNARCRTCAESRPIAVIASLNFRRSSAFSMACSLAPIISTPYLCEHAVAVQVERAVQRRLAAHRRQQRVGPLLGDDLLDHLPGDRLDVGDVGHLRVGHDRRRVAVDEDDPVALLAQRLAGLGAGVVELAGLADDDRAGADDQDAAEVGALRHCFFLIHQRDEAVEQVADVVRPGRRLRVALEAERRPVGAREALQRAVEQRHVRRPQVRRQRRLVDREAVVLAGDLDAAACRDPSPGGWRRDGRTSS